MNLNLLVILLSLGGKTFKLLMKTPQWVIDIVIAALIIVGVYGLFV